MHSAMHGTASAPRAGLSSSIGISMNRSAALITSGAFYPSVLSMSRVPRWIKAFMRSSSSSSRGIHSSSSRISLLGDGDTANADEDNNNNHLQLRRLRCNIALSWRDFMESSRMQQILNASKPRHLPKDVPEWEGLLKTAVRLWNELASVDEGATTAVYSVLCLLFKGTYLMQEFGSAEGRKRLIQQEATEGLMVAVVSCTAAECPCGFMQQLLRNHPHQLEDRSKGRTPLWIFLERRPSTTTTTARSSAMIATLNPATLRTMMDGNPKAASIQYQGEYPLQQACRRGYVWEGGLKELVEAAPQAAALSNNNNASKDNKSTTDTTRSSHEYRPVCLVAMVHAQHQEEEMNRIMMLTSSSDANHPCQSVFHRNQYKHMEESRRWKRELQVCETLLELLLLDPTVVAEWQSHH